MATTSDLTDRQQDIKRLLDGGKTPREIGEDLGITENAVYQHMRRMRQNGHKVGASTRRRGRPRKTAPTPASRPAPTPAAEPRMATPLQAIRARRDAISAELKLAKGALELAERAVRQASETYEKTLAKHTDELGQLDTAEAALTGKAAAKPKATRTAAKPKATRTKAPRKPRAKAPAKAPEFDQMVPSSDPVDAEFATA